MRGELSQPVALDDQALCRTLARRSMNSGVSDLVAKLSVLRSQLFE